MNRKLLKGFAGIAKFGLKLVTFSLILAFAFLILFVTADTTWENIAISSGSVATSIGTGVITVNGDQISKNDTQELYNFTLVIAGNVSNITIIVPRTLASANSANISVLNTTTVQLGTNLTGWKVIYIENFSKSGDPLRIQINVSDITKMLGADNTTSNTIWFALNGTPKISGATPLDNHTMTWEVYIGNDTSFSAVTKLTTLVDNKVPTIFKVVPGLNASGNTYIRGISADLFQVNVSEMNFNLSNKQLTGGATNVSLWYRKLGADAWQNKIMFCYNATGGLAANGLTNILYTCNTTIDVSDGSPILGAVAEGTVIQFFFNASDTVLNIGYNGTQDSPRQAQVDRTSPTSSNVASNVSYAKNSSYVTLSATFTDNFELANATLETNETGAWASQDTNTTSIGAEYGSAGSPWSMRAATSYNVNFTWQNQSILSPSIIAWRINVTDVAGNTNVTSSNIFFIDNDAPAVSFVSPANYSNLTGTMTLNVSASDVPSGMSLVYVNISYKDENGITNKKNVVLTQGITGFFNATVNSSFDIAGPAADGNYTFEIVANDTLNNMNRSQNIFVWIDNNAPAISITRPTENQVVTGLFTVEALVTDAVRISRVQYTISNATYTSGVFFQMLNSSGMLMNQSGVYNSTNITTANIFLDGAWNVTVWANDSANNIKQQNVTINIDNVRNATIFQPNETTGGFINGSAKKAGDVIPLEFSLLSNQYGLLPNNYSVSVYLRNSTGTAIHIGNVSNITRFWANGTVTIPSNTAANVIDDGNRTFLFITYDSQNNLLVNGSSNYTVSIDNTAPVFTGEIPINNSFNNGKSSELFQVSVVEVNFNRSQNITMYWRFTPTGNVAGSKTMQCLGSAGSGTAGPNWVCNTTLDLSGLVSGDKVYYWFNTSNSTHPGGELAGNSAYYGTPAVPLNSTVDRVVPAVGIISPLGSANISGRFTLNVSANNTPAGIMNVSYRITNNTFQSEMILMQLTLGTIHAGYWNTTNNTVTPGLADGWYRISFNVTDYASNANTTMNVTVFIDNTKPNVTIVTPTANLNYSTSILMNITARDSGIAYDVPSGDMKTIEYRLSNSTWSGSWIALTNTSENGLNFDHYNATNATSANFADGIYNITINVTDYANNFNDTQYVSIGIDRLAPVLSIISPTSGQFIKGSFNISAAVNDAVWVKNVWYRISNGTNTLDGLGSAYMAMIINSTINATNGGIYNGTNVTKATIFGDGTYNITVAANDTVNNVAYANVTVTIDNSAPVEGGDVRFNTSEPASGTEYVPGMFYRFNKTFNDTVGVVSVILQINATNFTAFRYEGSASNGNWSANVTDLAANTTGYPIIWYASDATGSWLTTTQWNYVVARNTTANITILANATTWERGTALNITAYSSASVSINATIYANISSPSITTFENLTAMYYVPFPRFNQNITISTQSMSLGKYNVTVNASATENYTAIAGTTLTITLQDSYPVIVFSSPVNNTNTSGTILVNASVMDASGVSMVIYNITNTTNQTMVAWGIMSNAGNVANYYNASISTTALLEGNYNLYVQANDTINNLNNSYIFNLTVDRTAPVIIFNLNGSAYAYGYTPVNATYKRGIVAINFTATDNPSDISNNGVSVRIGNATHWMGPSVNISVSLSANYIFNFTNQTNVMADGLYNFTATANDTAGNVRTNATWIYVDNTAPAVIAITNSTLGYYRPNASEQIKIEVYDALQTNASIDVFTIWPNGTVATHAPTGTVGRSTIYTVTIDTSSLVSDQMVKFYAYATDNASNVGAPATSLSTILSNITIDVNCGYLGRQLSFCSGSDLKRTSKWPYTILPPKTEVESIGSLQSNFTVENVTKRTGIWGKFNYTYYYTGSSWLSFDPNSAPSENSLKMFNNTGYQIYYFNVNTTGVVFRIE